VRITKSRNGQQRLLPVAPSASAWIERYLREVRPMLLSIRIQYCTKNQN